MSVAECYQLRLDRDWTPGARNAHRLCRAWDLNVPPELTGLEEGVRVAVPTQTKARGSDPMMGHRLWQLLKQEMTIMQHRELRTGSHGLSPIKLCRSADGESRVLTGLASVYDTWTSIGGRFLERVAPGAFADVLSDAAGHDVVALFNHDMSLLLARRSAGTLRLKDTSEGLRYEADLDQQAELGRRIARLVERKELTANSFSFTIKSQEWVEDASTGTVTRTIT